MHRSGTSALAGTLVRLGADAPRTLMPPNDDNPTGFWESEPIAQFHDRVLAELGTSWHGWTSVDDAVASRWEGEARDLVTSEFGEAPLFVLKEPRMCRLVPLWLRVLEQVGTRPVAIVMTREPAEVCASLAARDGFAPSYSSLLWLRHVLDAELATRGVLRTFVSYDELLVHWEGVASRLSHELRLTWPMPIERVSDDVRGFLEPTLRHHGALQRPSLGAPMDDWVARTWKALAALRERSAALDSIACGTLDEVRVQLDALAASIGRPEEVLRASVARRLADVSTDRDAWQVRARAAEVAARRADEALGGERRALEEMRHRAAEEKRATTEALRAAERGRQEARRVADERNALLQKVVDDAAAHAATMARLEGELAVARHHVEALLASWSWRVTRPLRLLADLVGARRP